MAFNQVQTGIQNNSDGVIITARAGKQGDMLSSELHGRYYEQTYRGNMFGITGAATTTTAGLNTTFTGLAVGNPTGSGVNLVLNKFSVAQLAASAAATVGIMGGVGSITASLTPTSRLIGSGGVSKMLATAGQTISTPVLISLVGSTGSVATTAYGVEAGIFVDFEGSIIVPPGSFIASYTTVATTTALQFGFVWEEVVL